MLPIAFPVFHGYYHGMSDTFLDLIQIAEQEIRRDSEDLTRLKQRYPGYDFVRVDQPAAHRVNVQSPSAELTQLERDVIRVMHSMTPGTVWTSRTVVTGMRTQNLRLPEKDDAAMNAVGNTLIALADAGRITRTHQGRGRDPHRYTVNIETQDQQQTPP